MDRSQPNSGGETPPQADFLPRRDRDLALTRLLRANDVITTAAILALGFTQNEITGLTAHGDLARIHRGVYVDGRTRLSPRGHLKAALLAAGPSAFLSHRTGAAARRYRSIDVREIHVSVIAASTPRIPGLILHRTTEPGRGEVSADSGLRVASLPRILVQIATTATDQELQDLITQGERRRALDSVADVLDRHGGHPGIRRLRHLLAHHISAPAGNSNLEAAVWAWYGTQPDLPPPDELNVHLGPFEFDGIWRKQRLILEIDSRTYHQARADMEKDRIKDAYVQKHGLRIIRVTDARFEHDKAGIHADLLAFLTQAA